MISKISLNSPIRRILFLLFIALVPAIMQAKPFRIIIDPGHGGDADKGAIFGNLEEKDLNLKLAKILGDTLQKQGVQVILTRETDAAMGLKERIELIEKIKPDLFIAIHFNSEVMLGTTRGFEIYYPSDDFSSKPEKYLPKYHRNNISFNLGRLFYSKFLKSALHETYGMPLNLFTSKSIMLFDETTVPGLLLEMAYLTSADDRACVENANYMDDAAAFISSTVIKIIGQNSRNN